MKTQAALLLEQPGSWQVCDVELDEPKDREVLVRIAAAGLCHSDDHFRLADLPARWLPYCGGHEGAGVVEAVGPMVKDLSPGDHIVTSFIPGCGRCRWCASGMQNLCDSGGKVSAGAQLDGTYRMHYQGLDVAQASFIGTFSAWSVMNESSCIKIPKHVPLTTAALLGCGVPTGWGSAVNAAQTEPGDVVIVMGIGGIGINAVQGASHAGAARVIAVDPNAFKREMALKVGATDAVEHITAAGDLARSLTNGQGADATIVTVGLLRPEHLAEAFATIRKAGILVVTAVANAAEVGIPVNLYELAMYQKRIQGVLYGMMAPSKDVPRLLALYENGHLKLDELVTRTYRLDEIGAAYEDLHAGRNIRGMIVFDS
jgi:NDMA-dependent alcohol dehydrogenase